VLNAPSASSQKYKDWVRSSHDWSVFINHPAMNMGLLRKNQVHCSES
jgi:hypothetical protein